MPRLAATMPKLRWRESLAPMLIASPISIRLHEMLPDTNGFPPPVMSSGRVVAATATIHS